MKKPTTRPLPCKLVIGAAALLCLTINVRADETNFKSLFNGGDLSGWQGVTSAASDSWKVEQGLLVCTGVKGTWLRSDAEYGDFNLRFDYKLRPGGNSGIYLRVPLDGAHREGGGAEVQLLDDRDARYQSIKPTQACGSIYLVAPAKQSVGRPAGEWNTMEIDCRGTSYRVTHNGILVLDANENEFPELAKRFKKGYLGLQNHSEEVWFRNLRIGPSQQPGANKANDSALATSDGLPPRSAWSLPRAGFQRSARRCHFRARGPLRRHAAAARCGGPA